MAEPYEWGEKPYSGSEVRDPYSRLRVGKITKVYNNRSELTHKDIGKLGSVQIEWLDHGGVFEGSVKIAYPGFSNPLLQVNTSNVPASTGSDCGYLYMPCVGDIVLCGFRDEGTPVVIGYQPYNFDQQTSTQSKASSWGTFRLLACGEHSIHSKQQAEIYLDKIGNIHLIVYEQPSLGSASTTLEDGSRVPLSTTTKPSTELARVTIGTVYNSEDFVNSSPQPVKSENGANINCRIKLANGALIDFDTSGNIDVTPASGKSVTINQGTKGVARLDDETLADATTTSSDNVSILTNLTDLKTAITAWSPLPGDGGGALKTALAAWLLTTVTQITGKISSSSDSVKAGD